MRFDAGMVKSIARQRGLTLREALRRAGVSPTAFYSLARRPSALPKTVTSLARALGVPPARLLREPPSLVRDRAEELAREARRVRSRSPRSEFANLWHTLNLLELEPAERLARSLTRGARARPTRPLHP